MPQATVKKNKIILADYNYRRDIENRLSMADLSTFEVDVLKEILNGSLKVTVSHLAEALNTDAKHVIPVINKLTPTKLVSLKGDQIVVDKEMRKYYESQILKFDDDFEAGMEYFQSLLSKVPIHHLPTWYSISRTSDSIFSSIVEKYLHTPKIYERYLQELHFDDPILTSILNDLFASPELKVPAQVLMEKYKLTRKKFEECLLILEFSCACCLCYNRVDDVWQEMVTPFTEWKEYLLSQRNASPKSIVDIKKISRTHAEDFGFIHDMVQLMNALQKKPLKLESVKGEWHLPAKIPGVTFGNTTAEYRKSLVNKILFFHFANIKSGTLHLLKAGVSWAKQPFQEQALTLFKLPVEQCLPEGTENLYFAEKDLRKIEQNLKRIIKSGWIYFDDFMKGFSAPIGRAEPVELKNRGKRWKYTLPTYTEMEVALVKNTIFDRLFCCGMIATGTHNKKPCFCITQFGKITLGD